MLPIKDFGAEIKAGYGLEILFQLIPMLVIQHLNSDNQQKSIQSISITIKYAQIVTIIAGVGFKAYEVKIDEMNRKGDEVE